MMEARKIKPVGMVVGLREDEIAGYRKFHADDNPGVRDLLKKLLAYILLLLIICKSIRMRNGTWKVENGWTDTAGVAPCRNW